MWQAIIWVFLVHFYWENCVIVFITIQWNRQFKNLRNLIHHHSNHITIVVVMRINWKFSSSNNFWNGIPFIIIQYTYLLSLKIFLFHNSWKLLIKDVFSFVRCRQADTDYLFILFFTKMTNCNGWLLECDWKHKSAVFSMCVCDRMFHYHQNFIIHDASAE